MADQLITQQPSAERPFVSYVQLILDRLAGDPGHTVLIAADGGRISAGALHESVHGMAAELADRGIRRGSSVAILAGNRPEALSARYAANLLGARVISLYEGMAAETLAVIVASVETELLLVEPEAVTTAEALLAHLRAGGGSPRTPLHADVPPGTPPSAGGEPGGRVAEPVVLSFGPSPLAEDFTAYAARHRGRRMASVAQPEDDWCIRFTGGTTGIPKGVRMAHGAYVRMLQARAALPGTTATATASDSATAAPCYLACTPLAHLAGLVADTALLAGGRVVLQRGFDPHEVLAAVERERINHLWLLPPLLYQLLDAIESPRGGKVPDTSSLRRINYGGCPASPARLRQAAQLLGPVLHGTYGQTEAGWISEVGPREHAVTGHGGQITVGRPAPGVEVAIRDEHGTLLPPGEVGEIQVRSRMLMSGYWKQPDRTAEVIRDGWAHTGDAGYLDEDGYLFIVDRLKDMIIVVGGHVYPAELEELLLTHPAVAHCAVFGVRRADATEEVHAAIVPGAARVPDLAEIREFVTEHMGRMYAPAALHVLDHIPLTAVGKPDRKRLGAGAELTHSA